MSETDVVVGEPIIDLVNARKDEIRSAVNASEQFKLGQNIAAEFKLEIDNETLYTGTLKRIQNKRQGKQYGTSYPLFNDDELVLTRSLETNPKRESRISQNKLIPIRYINMDTFKIVPGDEVNKKISAMEGKHYEEDKQAEFDEGFKSLKIEVRDTNPGDIPVPIEFQHKSVAVVVPVFKEVLPSTLISTMEEQKATPIFDEQKDTLNKLMSANKPLLEGSKILGSIEKVLQKDTQSELKARYDALKDSIKAPVEQLNKTLKSNLEKIALAHNSGIQIQLQKTTAATNETRRKYKLEIQKTRKQVADRLAGKTKSRLGLLKSSKLQGLEKSLSQEEAEIKSEIAIAKRYIGVKDQLLKWVDGSADKSKLTEEQIEAIVEAFNIDKYETACPNFIENMNRNTMDFIAFMLRELRTPLLAFGKTEDQKKSHEYIVFRDIVIKFLNSIIIMSSVVKTVDTNVDLQKLLSTTISSYEKNMYDNYFTPMILFDIKNKLLEILDDAIPILPKEDSDDDSEGTAKTTNSSNSVASTKSAADRRREQQEKAAQQTLQELDRITPQINRVKMAVSNTIPNIALGAVLLYTERDVKNLLGRKTGESKEKHYYLDVDGKVKKVGSNMTYKLSIKDDGTIPPQLAHLGTVKQASADSLSGTDMDKLYNVNDKGELFYGRPFPTLNLEAPIPSSLTTPSKSLKGPEPPAQAPPPPAPQRTVADRAKGAVKFLGRITGYRKSAKSQQVKGGRHRTRKHRKNKTHKKR
jgi:hypothetical protein